MNNEQKFLSGFENAKISLSEKQKRFARNFNKTPEKEKGEENTAAFFHVEVEKKGDDSYKGEIRINFEGREKILKFEREKPFGLEIEGISWEMMKESPVNFHKIIANEIEAFEKSDSYPKEIRFSDTSRSVAENSSKSDLELKLNSEEELRKFRKFFERI